MSFFQLGFITLFLSSALVSGYTTAAAVHVATSQVRHLLGVPSINATVEPGPLSVPKVGAVLCASDCRSRARVYDIRTYVRSCVWPLHTKVAWLCVFLTYCVSGT